MDIILASGSPRRYELLKQIGLDFKVITSEADEGYDKDWSPADIVMELSLRKAESVFMHNTPEKDTVVIGSDTIVVHKGRILGKPADKEEAFNMLADLSGDIHQVYTGVTLYYFKDNRIFIESFADKADVHFRKLSEKEIKKYVDSGEPMDKAGAYGIQGKGAILVEKIEGDFYTIVGLPVVRVYESLERNRVIY